MAARVVFYAESACVERRIEGNNSSFVLPEFINQRGVAFGVYVNFYLRICGKQSLHSADMVGMFVRDENGVYVRRTQSA